MDGVVDAGVAAQRAGYAEWCEQTHEEYSERGYVEWCARFFRRARPCKRCGGQIFYASSHGCRTCALNRAKVNPAGLVDNMRCSGVEHDMPETPNPGREIKILTREVKRLAKEYERLAVWAMRRGYQYSKRRKAFLEGSE